LPFATRKTFTSWAISLGPNCEWSVANILMVMARRQSRQNGSIPMNIKLLPNKCTQCIGNTKTAGTGKHLCGGEILGCQINGNMAAGTDHCENLQIGVGRK